MEGQCFGTAVNVDAITDEKEEFGDEGGSEKKDGELEETDREFTVKVEEGEIKGREGSEDSEVAGVKAEESSACFGNCRTFKLNLFDAVDSFKNEDDVDPDILTSGELKGVLETIKIDESLGFETSRSNI